MKNKSQKGMAIIMVLMIIGIISPLITKISYEQRITMQHVSISEHYNEASIFTLMVEAFAKSQLLADLKANKRDGVTDRWQFPLSSLPIGQTGATFSGRVVDLQSKININNITPVLKSKPKPSDFKDQSTNVVDAAAYNKAMKDYETDKYEKNKYEVYFINLLKNLQIEEDKIKTIQMSLRDWLDKDSQEREYGGEDEKYSNFENPRKVFNYMFTDLSELLLVQGITYDIYKKIYPYVSVIPELNAKININNAPDAVLKAILPEEAIPAIGLLLKARKSGHTFESIESFKKEYSKQVGEDLSDEIAEIIDVKTSYFEAFIKIKYGKSAAYLYSVLNRSGKKNISVVYRSFGNFNQHWDGIDFTTSTFKL